MTDSELEEGFNCCPDWKAQKHTRQEPPALSHFQMVFRAEYFEVYVWDTRVSEKPSSRHKDELVMYDTIGSWAYNKNLEHEKYTDKNARQGNQQPTPAGEELALLPRRIIEYALWERKFVQLDVKLLVPVVFGDADNPFDKLQIPAT